MIRQPMIRPATRADFARLQEIERAAGAIFRDVGMGEVADDAPPSIEELDRHRRAGLAWVAVGPAGEAVAYLIAEPVDAGLHVAQVSVHPAYAHRGIGRSLIDFAASYAADAGFPALTLTTFEDVAWNAPYYRRCGFDILDERSWTPGLRAVREQEAQLGLNRWPRVCMRRQVTDDG